MFLALIPVSLVAGTHVLGFGIHNHVPSIHHKEFTMSATLAYISLAAYESVLVGVSFSLAAFGFCPVASSWADGHTMQIIAVLAVVAAVAVVVVGLVSVIRDERKNS